MNINSANILEVALIALVIIYALKFYVSKLRNDGPDKIHYFTRVIFMSNLRVFLEIYNNFTPKKIIIPHLLNESIYYWYTVRTFQSIDQIKPVKIKITPSILCIQCDNRDNDYIINGKTINQMACEKHGFKYNFTDILQCDNPYVNKFIYLRSEMKKDYEYILWVDSDAYICPSFNINLLINNYPDSIFFASRDPPVVTPEHSILSKYYSIFCSGVFIIKNNSKGREFLDFIIDHLTNPEKINMYEKIDPTKTWAGFTGPGCDQGIMNVAIRKYRKQCTLLDYKYLNDSPNNLNEKSWIIHAMAKQPRERNAISLKVMKLWDFKM